MSTTRLIYQLICADFLERIRRSSFLITLICMVISGYIYLPPQDAPYRTFSIGSVRGVYNSAWVGVQVALLSSLFLGIFGFYLVRNGIERDYDTGVGQILATTPLSMPLYTIGKMLSNFAVLTTLVSVTGVTAGVMQLARAEETHIELWPLFGPLLVITLPAMAVVAAVAVIFETVPWLRGGLGNIVYFFLVLITLAIFLSGGAVAGNALVAKLDPMGIAFPILELGAIAHAHFPQIQATDIHLGIEAPDGATQLLLFRWRGFHWPVDVLLIRVTWVATAVLLTGMAGLSFSRFDPAVEQRQTHAASQTAPALDAVTAAPLLSAAPRPTMPTMPTILTPLTSSTDTARWWFMLRSELRLLLKGQRWWWYAIAGGLIAAMLVTPIEIAQSYLYPAAWIWPLLIWSTLGSREVRFHTTELVFSSPHLLSRQLPVQWVAGGLLALVTASGMIIRALLIGDAAVLFTLLVGACFVPSLALAAGTWTKSSRLFEVLYLFIWYAGGLNHIVALDFMGVGPGRFALQTPIAYLGVSLILLGLAVMGRRRQLRA